MVLASSIFLFSPVVTYTVNEYNDLWNYVFSYAILLNTETVAERISDVVMENCIKKELDIKIVARKIWKETKYRQNAISYVNGQPCAYGLMQVNLKYWGWKVFYHDDKKYAARLHAEPDFIKRAICYIGVNVDVGTDVLRHYLNTFAGDYVYALTSYWAGQNSREMRALKKNIRNHYIDDILDGKRFEDDMRLYNGWRYVEKKQAVKRK
jgi:hypothetical protein